MKSDLSTPKPVILVLEGLSGGSRVVKEAGGIPKSVNPNDCDETGDILAAAQYDGMLLTGGSDLNPELYGEHPHASVYGVNDERDLSEWYALDYARDLNIPVLGICRGNQMINVQAGGKLIQDMKGHSGGMHPVLIDEDSTIYRAMGGSALRRNKNGIPFATIMSYHHQEVNRKHLATGFRISAKAPDRTVEAIESLDGRVLGVQFHPEMASREPYARAIFRWLVTEAAERAGIPTPLAPPVYEEAWKPRVVKHPTLTRKDTLVGMDINTSYFCPFCNVTFDLKNDHMDHMDALHVKINGKWFRGAVQEALAPRIKPQLELEAGPTIVDRGMLKVTSNGWEAVEDA